MIITRTPLRISFLGGGTDLPAFSSRYGGACLSTTINKYIYITINDSFDGKFRAKYSETEVVDRPNEFRHPLIREALLYMRCTRPVTITSVADIPACTGLGSSSAFMVGLLNALESGCGESLASCLSCAPRVREDAEYEALARRAGSVEMIRCAKPVGMQDHYAAALGGWRLYAFHIDGTVSVRKVFSGVSFPEAGRFLLFYTGLSRLADVILADESSAIAGDAEKQHTLVLMADMARRGATALEKGKYCEFGRLLHESWQMKRTLAAGISSPKIDYWYQQAIAAGALGGKVCGAGGGGFLLFYVPHGHEVAVRHALAELREVPFSYDPQGSTVIYAD